MARDPERPGSDRRARVEQARREERRRERRRTLLGVGAAGAVGVTLVGVAAWQLVDRDSPDDAPLPEIGLSRAAAGCGEPVVEVPRASEMSSLDNPHVEVDVPVSYRFSPPAFGRHWGNYLQPSEVREFWTEGDRPPVERLVHSLEHGWTILWYDDVVAADDEQVQQLRAIGEHFADAQAREQKLMVAPFTAEDVDAAGQPFPQDEHLALTHWSVAGDGSQAAGQQGVWQYCEEVSGAAVQRFTDDYPWDDAPEPGAY